MPADALDRGVRQRAPADFDGRHSRQLLVPLERKPGGFQDRHRRLGDLRADPVAREECYGIRHSVKICSGRMSSRAADRAKARLPPLPTASERHTTRPVLASATTTINEASTSPGSG